MKYNFFRSFIFCFLALSIVSSIVIVLSEITVSVKDIRITYSLIAKIIHQTLEYMSWIGIPLILFNVVDQNKDEISNLIKQQIQYWKNLKEISETEREFVPFPVDIDNKEPEEVIIQALEDLKYLEDSIERCLHGLPKIVIKKYSEISKHQVSESEKWEIQQEIMAELFDDINLSIPNRLVQMEKYFLQLRVRIFEYKVQLTPQNKNNKIDLENYKKILEDFIINTSLID